MKNISIIGSTGTIGQNTIKLLDDGFNVEVITAGANVKLLADQAKSLNVKLAVIEDESKFDELKSALANTNIEVASGSKAIEEAASRPVDLLISAIVGAAALPPTLAAIRGGTTIGLANKECLVCAGDLMIDEVAKHGSKLIPIDSEHNSLFQAFDFTQVKSVEKLTLTASGGPFLNTPIEDFANITPEQAIKHPNWNMGAKISVDSATMMNKGLEIIEAYHLFPVEKEQIDVVIHPQSIIHAMVYYDDGSVLAGLSEPDMCVPISYALGWPKRMKNNTKRLDLAEIGKLTFFASDEKKFPALALAKNVLKSGGTAACVFNAANEIAVSSFLSKKISFLHITNVVEDTLLKMRVERLESLEHIFATDKLARKTAQAIIDGIN